MNAFLKLFIQKLGFFLLTIIVCPLSCFSVFLYAEIALETVAAQASSAGLKLGLSRNRGEVDQTLLWLTANCLQRYV